MEIPVDGYQRVKKVKLTEHEKSIFNDGYTAITPIKEYEEIMGFELTERERQLFLAGHTFGILDSNVCAAKEIIRDLMDIIRRTSIIDLNRLNAYRKAEKYIKGKIKGEQI